MIAIAPLGRQWQQVCRASLDLRVFVNLPHFNCNGGRIKTKVNSHNVSFNNWLIVWLKSTFEAAGGVLAVGTLARF